MTPTRSCRVGRTARCDGLTSAPRPAVQKKTAKMYGDNCDDFLLSVCDLVYMYSEGGGLRGGEGGSRGDFYHVEKLALYG